MFLKPRDTAETKDETGGCFPRSLLPGNKPKRTLDNSGQIVGTTASNDFGLALLVKAMVWLPLKSANDGFEVPRNQKHILICRLGKLGGKGTRAWRLTVIPLVLIIHSASPRTSESRRASTWLGESAECGMGYVRVF